MTVTAERCESWSIFASVSFPPTLLTLTNRALASCSFPNCPRRYHTSFQSQELFSTEIDKARNIDSTKTLNRRTQGIQNRTIERCTDEKPSTHGKAKLWKILKIVEQIKAPLSGLIFFLAEVREMVDAVHGL